MTGIERDLARLIKKTNERQKELIKRIWQIRGDRNNEFKEADSEISKDIVELENLLTI